MLAAYAWRWEVLLQPVPSGGGTYLDWIVAGVRTTAILSLCSWFLALALGTATGVLRTLPGRLPRLVGAAYVELFRNVPLLVQLFIWYFVVPELAPVRLGTWFKQLDPVLQQLLAAILCLAFFTGARICEQVRAGINSLSRGQKAAALALGFTLPQTYANVLLPMGFRIIVPPLASEMVNLVKNSEVASTINLLEAAAMSRQLVDYTARSYESFTAVTVLYILVNVVVLGFMRWVEAKARVPGFMGGGH
jgi:glutamate/aspartate transport system permease protein